MSGERPTEYGGSPQRNGIQPPVTPDGKPGHLPTSTEELRLQYLTGQMADSTRKPDDGEAFAGLDPLDTAIAKRRSEGITIR
jgi:hypothetical protein